MDYQEDARELYARLNKQYRIAACDDTLSDERFNSLVRELLIHERIVVIQVRAWLRKRPSFWLQSDSTQDFCAVLSSIVWLRSATFEVDRAAVAAGEIEVVSLIASYLNASMSEALREVQVKNRAQTVEIFASDQLDFLPGLQECSDPLELRLLVDEVAALHYSEHRQKAFYEQLGFHYGLPPLVLPRTLAELEHVRTLVASGERAATASLEYMQAACDGIGHMPDDADDAMCALWDASTAREREAASTLSPTVLWAWMRSGLEPDTKPKRSQRYALKVFVLSRLPDGAQELGLELLQAFLATYTSPFSPADRTRSIEKDEQHRIQARIWARRLPALAGRVAKVPGGSLGSSSDEVIDALMGRWMLIRVSQ